MKRSAPLVPADGLIALAFAAAYVALLLATAGDLGYARVRIGEPRKDGASCGIAQRIEDTVEPL